MPEIEKIQISCLNDYLTFISDFRKKLSKDEGAADQRLFFRGQENENWAITPSVFRNDYLSIEGKIIRMALSRSPGEFKDHATPFERLTKLQHYGMNTRLLDITLNPLVAMYFACLPCYEYEEKEELSEKSLLKVPCNGAVYYKREYETYPDSEEVKIISIVASMDFRKDIEISELLHMLMNEGMNYQSPEKQQRLFDILQGNYFVLSNQNNDRLIRQSGTFLLPGAININRDTDLSTSRISKGIANLQSEFSEEIFIVDCEKKEEILEEIDFYNINEATLFPELEHQMNYLKLSNSKFVTSVSPFSKLEVEVKLNDLANISDESLLSKEELEEALTRIIKEALKGESPELEGELVDVFINNAGLDWYKRDQIQADIKHHLSSAIRTKGKQDNQTGKRIAEEILEKAISSMFDATLKNKAMVSTKGGEISVIY